MIYEPFNLTFWIMIAIEIIFLIVTTKMLKKKDDRFIRNYLLILYIVGIIVFIFYKIALVNDQEYLSLKGIDDLPVLAELPLNPCNIVLCLMPIVILTKNKLLSVFCFYTSMIGAMTALVLPTVGFHGCSVFLPRMMGFIISHLIAFTAWVYMYSLGLYKVSMKDPLILVVSTFVVGLCVFILNVIFIKTGICDKANYFYTIYPANSFLEGMYEFIPIKFVYIIPGMLIEGFLAFVLAGALRLLDKIKERT